MGSDRLDLPALAAALGRRLRAAGIPVTPERSARFARALALVAPVTRERLHAIALAVFVSDREQVAAFDAVFAAVFDGFADPAQRFADRGAPAARTPAVRAQPGEREPAQGARRVAPAAPLRAGGLTAAAPRAEGRDGPEREAPVALASPDERLAHRSFAELEPDELAQLRRLMARLALAPPVRRSRRRRRGRRGERIDLRRTVRAALRTGGDPVVLTRRRRRRRPRGVVMLCDISGSMEPYTRAYLQFLASASAAGAATEAFTFATRLTRVTRALRGPDPEAAIRRAAGLAPDWSSGTRIGEALRRFNQRYGRRGVARGAVVVILSDGWEHGDPAIVAREMERLARLAHRIVWVNPRVAAPGFAPRTGGMAAALPSCDALLSGHDLAALGEVAGAIAASS